MHFCLGHRQSDQIISPFFSLKQLFYGVFCPVGGVLLLDACNYSGHAPHLGDKGVMGVAIAVTSIGCRDLFQFFIINSMVDCKWYRLVVCVARKRLIKK